MRKWAAMARLRKTLLFALTGALLLGATLSTSALTLGRIQGAAWIGQPLDLVIPVQFEQESSDGGLCPQVDIFDGDSRQDPGQVRASLEISGQGDAGKVHITSTVPVDEPVVTVYLRLGCNQKVARRFVLLAELKTNSAPPPVTPPVAPNLTITAAPGPVATPAPTPVPGSSTEAPKAANGASQAEKTPVAKTHKAPVTGRPRLQLDVVDAAAKNAAKPPAAVAPAASAAASAAAPKASSQSTPEAPESAQVKALQSDLQRLLDQANTNQAAILAMRNRLEEAQSAQMPLIVLYVLLALIVVCLAALAFAWTRHNALMAQRLRQEDIR